MDGRGTTIETYFASFRWQSKVKSNQFSMPPSTTRRPSWNIKANKEIILGLRKYNAKGCNIIYTSNRKDAIDV